MTVPSTPSEISYAGDDVTVAFPITFPFDTSADIVIKSTDADGNVSDVTNGYTVTGGSGSTGTATAGTAPASGVTITILDDPEQSQETDYIDNDPFPAPAHERALDKQTRLIKRLSQIIARTLRFADADPSSDGTLGSVDNRKGKFLFFNAVSGAVEYALSVGSTIISQSIIGGLLNPQTTPEEDAAVTINDYSIPSHDKVGYILAARYGIDTTGVIDATAAIQAAVDVAEVAGGLNTTVVLPHGQIRVDGLITCHQGTMIMGPGSQGSTLGYGTSIDHGGTGGCFLWDGNGASAAGTGGGLQNVVIVKRSGVTGGDAIKVLATDDNHRPGEMVFRNVLVYGTGTGMWARGFHLDGSACVTAGSKGVRSVRFDKVRVATCSTDNEYVLINQGVHITGDHLQIDTAGGSGNAGMKIMGDSENVNLTTLIINGELQVNDNATHVNLQGRITTLDVNNASAIGSFIGSASTISNQSKTFKTVSTVCDSFAAKRTTDQANVTGNAEVVTVLYDSQLYDRGDSFDPATGIFIAKHAGLYQFNAVVSLSGLASGHTAYEVSIVHRDSGGSTLNTIASTGNPFALSTPTGTASFPISCQLELSVSDSVRVLASVTGGATVVDITGAATTYTSFSGALL